MNLIIEHNCPTDESRNTIYPSVRKKKKSSLFEQKTQANPLISNPTKPHQSPSQSTNKRPSYIWRLAAAEAYIQPEPNSSAKKKLQETTAFFNLVSAWIITNL